MSFAINEFLGRVSQHGTAKQSLFQVRINPPRKLKDRYGGQVTSEHLRFRVSDVEIPGRSVQTIDSLQDIGAVRKIGYNAQYQPVTTSMMLSDDMRERVFFQDWQSMVVGDHGSDQLSGSANPHPSAGSNWSAGYYNDYISSLVIETFDETGQAG